MQILILNILKIFKFFFLIKYNKIKKIEKYKMKYTLNDVSKPKIIDVNIKLTGSIFLLSKNFMTLINKIININWPARSVPYSASLVNLIFIKVKKNKENILI